MSGLAIWCIIFGTAIIASPASVGRWCARAHKAYERELSDE